MRNRTVDILWANVFAIALLFVFAVLSIWLWQVLGWEINLQAVSCLSWLFFGLGCLAGFVVHELLHGVAFAHYSKNGWKGVTFGVIKQSLTPFCHGNEPIMVKQYIVVVLFPLVVLGIIPWVVGLWIGNGLLTIWGVVFILAAAGDILMSFALRQEKANAYVMDHPCEAGCLVSDDYFTEIPAFEPIKTKRHKSALWVSILFGILCAIVLSVGAIKWDHEHRFYGTASTEEMAEKFINTLKNSPEFTRTYHITSLSDSAKATEIREYFQLDTLFALNANTWEKAIAIATFVNTNIPHANQKENPQHKDAIGLWEYTQHVEPALNALYHSILTSELLQSVGIEERVIFCYPEDASDPDCMVINHVWIPKMNKWVMLTTCNSDNWASDANGTPLSLPELRNCYIQGQEINFHSLTGEPSMNTSWFYAYMAKDTYWFQTFETQKLGMFNMPHEELGAKIALVPIGYNPDEVAKKIGTCILTHDEETFWAAPQHH